MNFSLCMGHPCTARRAHLPTAHRPHPHLKPPFLLEASNPPTPHPVGSPTPSAQRPRTQQHAAARTSSSWPTHAGPGTMRSLPTAHATLTSSGACMCVCVRVCV